MQGFGSASHLVARFFSSLLPVGPSAASEQWALGQLSAGEAALFSRMTGPDRRHAIGVARRALALAGREGRGVGELPAGFVAAALLHDVGKVEARLGTVARALVTLAALVFGRERLASSAAESGWRRRVRGYVTHDRVGAHLLEVAGSQALVISWAREHHLAPHRWSVDRHVGTYLKQADGD